MLDCGNPIKATNVVPTPVYKCNAMTAAVIDRTTRKFTTTATATNGAKVKSYNYNFGDSSTKTVNSTSTTNTIDHSYSNQVPTPQRHSEIYCRLHGEIFYLYCKVTVVEAPKHPAVEITKLVNGQKEDEIIVGENFIYNLKVKTLATLHSTT